MEMKTLGCRERHRSHISSELCSLSLSKPVLRDSRTACSHLDKQRNLFDSPWDLPLGLSPRDAWLPACLDTQGKIHLQLTEEARQELLSILLQKVAVRETGMAGLVPLNHFPGAHTEHLITVSFCLTEKTKGEFSVGLLMEMCTSNRGSQPTEFSKGSQPGTHWPWRRYILNSLQEISFEMTSLAMIFYLI